MLPGQLAVADTTAANYSTSAFDGFVHGTSHPEYRIPFRLNVWLTNNARLILHLNSVSSGPSLAVRADGSQLYRTNLPNLDGGYAVNNEYDIDLAVNLPAGKRIIDIVNLGQDWFFLDWVRFEGVVPAAYASNWQPPCEPIGLTGPHESLVYLVAPGVGFPGSATNAVLPLQHGQSITLTNWLAGDFIAEWYDPLTASLAGYTQATTTNRSLTLPLPDFREDLAGLIYRPPSLRALGKGPSGGFQVQVDSETGGRYWLESSSNLVDWLSIQAFTNASGATALTAPDAGLGGTRFYRTRQQR
jgi:hypothetical protein